METLIIFSFIFIFFPIISAQTCRPGWCDAVLGPEVRFPFRLSDRQPQQCGYPGFDLSCNSLNQTILNLPGSGEFIVDEINYAAQSILIGDPDSCLPYRILNFNLSGSPFRRAYNELYNLFNCPYSLTGINTSSRLIPLFCISGENYTVVALSSYSSVARLPPLCRRMVSGSSLPMRWSFSRAFFSRKELELAWDAPACRDCEIQGDVCGYAGGSDLQIGCSRPSRSGLPRGAKYGIIIGVGIPALLCITGLVCYNFSMLRAAHHRRQLGLQLPITVSDQRPSIRSAPGLDRPTIESYPKTVLGESRRLPKSNNSMCPICLCDYMPKETLRSIPPCNHYFHSSCIDEWLKLNGTCPLCRNSPEDSISSFSWPDTPGLQCRRLLLSLRALDNRS